MKFSLGNTGEIKMSNASSKSMHKNRLAQQGIHGELEAYGLSLGLLIISMKRVTKKTLPEAKELVTEARALLPVWSDLPMVSCSETGIELLIVNVPPDFSG
jgi:hypothetical protein